MLAGLIDRLSSSGVRARAAIADSWGAAHALARYAARPVLIAPLGHGGSVLTGLPLAALRLPADMVAALHVLGFERIGDLLAQPRAPLTLRFGPQLGRRIDQALGILSEPIEPIRPDELIEVKRNFAEPIGAAETIARHIGELVVQLCAGLEAEGLGAKRLDLICHRVDDRVQAVRVGVAMPVRDVKRLTRLLTDKIDTIEPGFGIETLSLAATLAEPLAEKQTLTAMVDDGAPDVSDLVDTLVNRVGEQQPLPSCAGRHRDARALGAPNSAHGAGHRRDMAGALASAIAAVAVARADRDDGRPAGSSAGRLHLARRPAARPPGRRTRAHPRRMVAARCRADRRA